MKTPRTLHWLRVLAIATTLTTSPLSAKPITFTLTPAQDALLRSDNASTENTRALAVSNRGPEYRRRTLLQFNPATLASAQGFVKAAALKLVPSDLIGPASTTPVTIALWGVVYPNVPPWSEDRVLWNTAPLGAAELETSTQTPGAIRLGATEFDSSNDQALRDRRPVVIDSSQLAAYLNWALARPSPSPLAGIPAIKTALPHITLIVTSEAEAKSPGVFFFSKDNRPEAREVYPVLEVTIE
ncbi:MAG TPA: hypothetical protein VIO38_11335 [Rariglobus sp.]